MSIRELITPEAIELSNEEIRRYSRHLIMPEVGMAGQKKLKAASVLLIGAGGLGSPLAMYLAAAGVGRIGLVDYDVVDYTNLQRQIIHGTKDVGRPKLASAKERIVDINPHIQVDTYEVPLMSDNALELFAPYDVIIDGTDNFPTRYLTNDACVLLGKPNVYGSIFRFEGQASVFYAKEGPCYRCLFPEPPPPGLVPSCAEGGVLGVLPGTIGAIQATEAIKLILGSGTSLIGRLLLYDALSMSFDEVRLRKNPRCPVCGENPTLTELIDYEQFCGMPAHDRSLYTAGLNGDNFQDVPQMSPATLNTRLAAGERPFILDVREPHEWDISNLAHLGAVLIPKGKVLERMNELDTAQEIVVHCRTGVRSAEIVRLLRQHGFSKLYNLEGGINRWADEVDPSIAKY
ncbi:MAG: molybdopterin-synthase adenylyltransferase MoeB [Chloroflexi bacterium]|nr:molybdopterin-synthase adenylyltransferase MoeB [Chloroflexota bacterium]MCI0574606.1 molybdopterin-synthase adenylyltransferase MoeB [Chloroflexota bacterium]MCI0644042.1 molybdopterin-synthase adenylyltransferase MoeB [Chloroflexota bacterium]MCI0731716.1 molybdopterin-synthase adenylyltransferase MoeB [Chloroflexota bacterium]